MFNNSDIYVIAEVGQNHQGDIETALKYVSEFSALGANAIKFQMRDNKYLFSYEKYNSLYDNPNSFSKTYGQHRDFLELTFNEMLKIRKLCARLKVDFICTPFDEPSLDALVQLDVDAFKISSFDLGNIPFLERVASLNKPVVMSTGGGNSNHIINSVKVFEKHGTNLALLHCVSKYPCTAKELLLGRIPLLVKQFPGITVGSSDHFNGILSGPVAYLLGARVFEKHVTFNRSQKGNDHSFSLEKEGFRKFVRDLYRTKDMLTTEFPKDLGTEPVFDKLGKSLILLSDLNEGDIISHSMLSGKIFDHIGIPVRESYKILGAKLKRSIRAGELIEYNDLSIAK